MVIRGTHEVFLSNHSFVVISAHIVNSMCEHREFDPFERQHKFMRKPNVRSSYDVAVNRPTMTTTSGCGTSCIQAI